MEPHAPEGMVCAAAGAASSAKPTDAPARRARIFFIRRTPHELRPRTPRRAPIEEQKQELIGPRTKGSPLMMGVIGGGATGAISTQRETMGDGSISIQRSTHGDRTGSSLGNISDIASCHLG